MITHVSGTDVAVPQPRTGEPAGLDELTVRARAAPPPAATSSGEHPILVAARLEESAAVVAWVGRLALLVAVGLMATFLLLV